jgi:hypothetical protein
MRAMKKYRFTAEILPANGGGATVLFPYNVQEEFGTNGKVPVQATFNGVPYTGTLIRYGHPQHMLPVLKAIREEIGKRPGDRVEVVLWKDDAVRTIDVPAELQQQLKKEGLLPFFEKLSYSHRKEYCRWIHEAKKEETRQNRVEKAIAMLKRRVKTPV